MNPEQLFAWLARLSALLATFRAGSRALYRISHGGSIGLVDGPPILGPGDVPPQSSSVAPRDGKPMGVSPLWEASYALRAAVLLGCHEASLASASSRVARMVEGKGEEEWKEAGATGNGAPSPSPRRILRRNPRRKAKGTSESERVTDLSSFLAWLRREIAVPFHAIPSWQRLIRTYGEQRWRGGRRLDLDSTVDAVVPLPSTTVGRRRVARVTAHAPRTFASLRSRFRVSEADYLSSLVIGPGGAGAPHVGFTSNSKGAARAGTYFFFSRDGAYMCKTIKKEEVKAVWDMLPKYYRFFAKRGNIRRSLLTRFCGIYTIHIEDDCNGADARSADGNGNMGKKSKKDEEHVFIVMNSVFPVESSGLLTEMFDLKGSTVGRECSMEERKKKGSRAVLKDLDLAREVEAERRRIADTDAMQRRISRNETGIHVGKSAKTALLSQLRRDVGLLKECSVMDYSLLVGVICREDRKQDDSGQSYYGAASTGVYGGSLSILPGTRHGRKATYFLGLIDFLQPWTIRKVLERDLKWIAGYNAKEISCVAPGDYSQRFLRFLEDNVT